MAELNGKAPAIMSGFLGTAVGVLITYFTALTDLARLDERLIKLETLIAQGTDDRYRGADARRDFALVDQQIRQNAKQIEELHELIRNHTSSRQEHPR